MMLVLLTAHLKKAEGARQLCIGDIYSGSCADLEPKKQRVADLFRSTLFFCWAVDNTATLVTRIWAAMSTTALYPRAGYSHGEYLSVAQTQLAHLWEGVKYFLEFSGINEYFGQSLYSKSMCTSNYL